MTFFGNDGVLPPSKFEDTESLLPCLSFQTSLETSDLDLFACAPPSVTENSVSLLNLFEVLMLLTSFKGASLRFLFGG